MGIDTFGQQKKPVCTYYARGYCRYGDNCRFDHPFKGTSATAVVGAGTAFGGQARQAATPSTFTELLNGIATEMKTWENSKQWPFSCFSPLKGQPCIPGLSDLSPEEIRTEAYKSQVANTPDVYLQFFNTQVAEYQKKRASLHNASPEMRNYMQQMFNASLSGGSGGAGSVFGATSQSSKSLFGGGSGATQPGTTAGLFGKPAGQSVFGSQQTGSSSVFGGQQTGSSSVFGGQQTSGSSVFGGQPQAAGSVFGGQAKTGSVFGGQATTSGSVFGGQTQSSGSVFGGQPQQTASVFGGQTQTTGSVFGGQAQPASSVFGGQAQPTGSVFGGQTQPTSSVFGGQAQPTSSVFGGQAAPQQSAAGSVFGGHSQPSGSVSAAPLQTPSGVHGSSVFGGQTTAPAGSVLTSQSQPVSAAGDRTSQPVSGSGLFGKGGPAASVDPQPAHVAMDAYSEPSELSEQDQAQFAAAEFTLGKVPLLPPTREMCAR